MIKSNWIVVIVGVALVAFICFALSGCATPGIKGTFSDGVVKIEPVSDTSLWTKIFGSKLPAGEYKATKGDMSLEVKTSKDFKLLDINANKMSGN